ncbi:SH2 domain-containing protein A-like isoform X2 [Actinidia eriantha]|uniref:SH2 domain-containing protein A-like isoform X2 n=1 Tax=Actinidia eriantha TaxID=165200 RepID=UPI00258377D6|nr:SH2 domain-containing protein A-like isoform X2 [Actinidia eriantha]XP_057461324.1 SH2 domain-containing protein A-like isoform X2 [Actinidia eriantha]
MESNSEGTEHDYSSLKDLRLEINSEDRTFSLCFWIFLSDSTPFSSTILRQMHPEIQCGAPFLVLDEKKKMMLFPLLFLHAEAPGPHNANKWTEIPHASARIVFPFEKWVHVGCEVATGLVRLHIDGEIVGEKLLTTSLSNDSNLQNLSSISLAGTDGDDNRFHGYVHSLEVMSEPSSIKVHFLKDPPLQLSVDGSSASEIEEDNDGVWSIVGGKASCRRNFSLDVILLNAFGEPINKEMEVVASLLYADNGADVEKPDDAEAPLLTSYDGIEFACCDRPSKLTKGRAAFKLKISQLSSKCDNRMFRIRFDIPKMGRYPFFEAFSNPIRCISRNRNTRTSPLMSKKLNSGIHLFSGSPSSGLDDGPTELLYNIVHEAKLNPPMKWVKLGRETSFATRKPDLTMDRDDKECNSHALTANEDDNNAYGSSLERRPENHEETDNSPSDSESIDASNSDFKSLSGYRSPVSDMAVFKYCLGGLNERALLLKEVSIAASEKELADFAQQVSLYLGCSHHGRQIIIAKRLVEEGMRAWDLISQNNPHVIWEHVVFEIKQRFMKIARCSSRFLTQQDLEILRRIAGCQELVAQENFEKMWCWLFPVAFTLSRDWVNAIWNSASPRWIEGFITKEEAESSLQSPGGLQEPGTFVLRFPTSRSWPHPDAGNLVATYIGNDYNIHHRLLSLDFIFSSGEKRTTSTPLQDMLLAQPEFSRLGRIIRSH